VEDIVADFMGYREPKASLIFLRGEWGGLRPVEQLQQVFGYRNALQFPKRVFIREVEDKLDANGILTDGEVADRLATQAKGFAEFVQCVNG
jgi:NAD(P)H-dependent FMN reductase